MRALSELSEQEFEDVCDGCAKCCAFPKARGIACPGLDVETNRCTVYEKRFDTYICAKVTSDNVMSLHDRGILPDSCAYVRWERGQPALPRPVEAAVLIPFMLAPRDFQRRYNRANKAYLKSRSSAQ